MKPEKITSLLLDLDGTLLEVDLNVLIPAYLEKLSLFFSHLLPPKVTTRELYATTQVLVENNESQLTNEELFFKEFTRRVNLSEEKIRPLLDQFYTEEYPRLESLASPHPHAPDLLNTALEKKLDLVIATNPIFPRAAIEERLRWAGLEGFPYALVTTIENMHYCKPRTGYYLEIAHRLERAPEHCLMAGNDVIEDLAAHRIGMGTYLVEEHVVNPENQVPEDTRRGKLSDLKEFIASL